MICEQLRMVTKRLEGLVILKGVGLGRCLGLDPMGAAGKVWIPWEKPPTGRWREAAGRPEPDEVRGLKEAKGAEEVAESFRGRGWRQGWVSRSPWWKRRRWRARRPGRRG